jgi:amino acid adenylation domain-containing protein/non-ribosomal peptide synthase protein (TIGR01720 family)
MVTHIADLTPQKRKLLELLLKEKGVDPSHSLIMPQRRETNRLPLSYAQERLWFLDQFEPDSPYYNIPAAVRLTGRLDVKALEQALNEIVRRHESLRTTFSMVDDEPIQVISPSLTLSLPVLDLREMSEAGREAEARRLASWEAGRPFDLSRGPLLRVTLLRLEAEDYLVLVTMHHIISDGWSIGVFIGELSVLYDASSSVQPSPLPELPIQYADFALWQREWLEGEVLEDQLAYWKRQLGGDPSLRSGQALGVLELPTDRPRPAIYTNRGSTESLELSAELAQALHAVSRQERTTPFMTLLSAFQVLLQRYTGQDSISVGSPIANRNRSEIEGLIGFFVNTLVLRTDLSDDPTFREVLRRVREVTLGAYAHQDLPFEMLVDALQPERDMSRTPLFQVMFILQNAPVSGKELPGLTLRQVETHSGTSTFDLTLSVGEVEDGLSASVEYNLDLFDATTIRRMLRHFETLLEGAVANPDQPISSLPLLTEEEQHQLLVDWNDTAADYALRPDLCVHRLFEAQAERTPDSIALVVSRPDDKAAPWQALTYAELNRRANQLAHYLRRLGVGPESLVGVCFERSPEMIVGLLGVLKAGGAYLPLDPLYPPDRLAFMLADSGVPVLLTQARLAADLPPHAARCVCLDGDWQAIAAESAENLANRTRPDHLAYVIYTSGSTGQSKGVMIEQRSLANAYHAWDHAYGLRQLHAHLQMANFAFDVFSGDLVRALCSGAKLILAPREWLLEPEPLYALMQREGIDAAEFVPAVLRHLVQHLQATGQRLGFMRLLACGSDSWYAGEYRQFRRICGPDTRLINSFGLTEATIDSTYFEAEDLELAADQLVPIGRPFADQRTYVLDRHLQPVPVGVPGELYVGGAGLARGYLNRPELSAEKFVPDPFGTQPGGRLYRTGDLARYQLDGNLEFLGRLDHQVKIRGFRIEPGEIEAALAAHPALRQAAVLAVDVNWGEDGTSFQDKRLVAYVVPKDEGRPTAVELRRHLQGKVPDYMIPAAFVTLEELPLTPNGKVDRAALPAPHWSRRELAGEYVAPRTPVEETLAGIWAQVLRVERIGVHDNFFALGGHSLLVTQLVSRVRQAFQVELPLRSVFEAPTVAALAEHVEIAQRKQAGVQAPPIRPVPREGELPLSFAQQRLWFLDQLEPGSPLYNVPDVQRITGPLNVAALERSLNEIVRRHEVLRTTFPTIGGKPIQVIAPELTISLTKDDLSDLPEAEREAAVFRRATLEAQQPFDLATGPLLRAALLRLGEQDHVALLTMHHVVSDGWSTVVLTQELSALYQAYCAGQPSPLPELPIQYADFARWQRNWLQGEVLETQLAYWKEQLSGSPPVLELPTDRPRPAVQGYRGNHTSFTLPEDLIKQIKALCQQEGVTLFMALLAAFQTLLYRYSGQEDISVGTPIANRNRAEIEGLVGFFVNTLVLRTDLSGDPSFRDLLKQVRQVALGAYAHQDVPFEMVVDALEPKRNLSYSPLFQVMFALQNMPATSAQPISDTGLTLSPVEVHSGTAKFDLILTLAEQEETNQVIGIFEYNADLFQPATIERMATHFQTLLESILAEPEGPISRLPLLPSNQLHQLLVEWNATAIPYSHEQCVHQLFQAQAERTPDAIAVSAGDRHVTYRELDRRTNQLAHRLQKLGVGPGTPVGLCVQRSIDLVLGALAVLKAGGAYLALDPAYPTERLAFMLEDAQAPVLLTQADLHGSLPQSSKGAALPAQVIYLDADRESIAQPDHVPPCAVTPRNLAYVIYTSGSTGRPKGVPIEHQGLVNLIFWHRRAFAVGETDRATQVAGPGFDASVWEIWPYLTAGASIHVLPDENRASPTLLRDWLVSQAITLTFLPTPLAENVLWLEWPDQVPLRTLLTGGDKLRQYPPPELPFELVNNYGPTEDTVVTTSGRVPPTSSANVSAPSIGRPIDNTQVYVLDSHLQPVPIGVPGELHVGGAGLSRGYLGRPELAAGRFIPNPFAPLESGSPGDGTGARLYRTGDLVRYLPGGDIEFLGRIDHQVKLRGFRIELGEIEVMLAEHPAVRESVVLVREDTPEDKRLVAYVIPREEVTPTAGELRRFLKARLPEYMLPAAFVMLETFPLTPNGKVNRQALPAPEHSRLDLENPYVPPRTAEEEILAGIWCQILGIEHVGVHDNFFELGGDSILSIQVIARANQAGLGLSPRQLFQYPTVAGLAAVAGQGRAVHAEQGMVEGPVPLTPIQRWFFEQGLPERHHWNQSVLLEVGQALEPDLLQQALGRLLEHHDALRLRFHRDQAGWEQVNAGPEDEVPLDWIDLSELPAEARAAAIEARAGELQTSLDLQAGPLLRAAYFDPGAGRSGRLLIVAHHLVMDGVSWRILMDDLPLVYDQLRRGAPVQLPPKATSFRYWAKRLVEYAQTESLRAELPHWLALAEQPASAKSSEGAKSSKGALPVDYPGGANREASARQVTVSLDPEETQSLLQDVPGVYRTEINDVLVAALTQAIAGWTGVPALLLELEAHGREAILDDVDISRTVGWFTSLYPVLLRLPPAAGPGEALKSIKEQLRRVPGRGLGYGLLRYLCRDAGVVRQLRSLPQPEISFNYLGQFDGALPEASPFRPAGESRGPERGAGGDRPHALDVNGGVVGGRLQMEWTYSQNLHRRETIERVAGDFLEALRAIIAHCQSPEAGGVTPSDFKLAGLDQRGLDKVLARLNKS